MRGHSRPFAHAGHADPQDRRATQFPQRIRHPPSAARLPRRARHRVVSPRQSAGSMHCKTNWPGPRSLNSVAALRRPSLNRCSSPRPAAVHLREFPVMSGVAGIVPRTRACLRHGTRRGQGSRDGKILFTASPRLSLPPRSRRGNPDRHFRSAAPGWQACYRSASV